MGQLRVRSVLVTGANRGIGLGFVQHLLALPNPPEVLFATCRDPKAQRAQLLLFQELQKLASKHRNLVIVPLEVTDPASIKAATASVGEHLKGSGLNLLINNAALLKVNTLDTETLKDMSEVYTTNTVAPLLLSQAALNMLTRCQSLGYREHGILCVALHPGWVQTDMGNSVGDKELQKLASKHRNLVIVPLEVTDPASIKAAAASVGEHLKGSGLNLLINNAGIVRETTLDTETLKDMSDVYTTNTVAPLLLSQALLPLLKKAAQGSPGSGLSCSKAAIVNISSIGGSIKEVTLWEAIQAVSYRCSKPPVTVDASVGGMLKVLSSLSEKDTGTFLDWEGNIVPW
ncbi:hypothetical protein ASZ78_009041 [Callipepla squamata]|uniref:Uncharacterized protein n=1 Tax=Callipepla squamata TaxID=9009 RepID=A0A226MT33_CALSU|nr:hypothetical protein ASZ78_009041 [Callipepla squamata]